MVIEAAAVIENAPPGGEVAAPSWEWTRGQPATLATLDGRRITGGIAMVSGTAADWCATVSHLDRPGCVAAMYFGEGVRYVVLDLQDGRHARARIASTAFVSGAERVCEIVGIERLS